ncbi:MAG: type II toxin-antitoxin system VapC family toxin [Acidimicrobiia bacterium]
MTIVDASALFTALVAPDDRGHRARAALEDDLAAPSMLRAEVASAVRGESRSGRLDDEAARRALRRSLGLAIRLHPAEPFLPRMWELRHNVTPYDAWYVALAEALDAPLLTTDRRLARSTGVRCEVRVV